MSKVRKIFSFCIGLTVGAVSLLSYAPIVPKAEEAPTAIVDCSGDAVELETAIGYKEYLDQYQSQPKPDQDIHIDNTMLLQQKTPYECIEHYEGMEGLTVLSPDSGTVTWQFTVTTPGMYCLEIQYFTVPGKGSNIMRSLRLDGALPFSEARNLNFTRFWMDKKGADNTGIQQDEKGNDLRPSQVEVARWNTVAVTESSGFSLLPLEFYLSAGAHTISLTAIQEPMAIRYLEWYHYTPAPDAGEVRSLYTQKRYVAPDIAPVKIQAESPSFKSDANIMPVSDRSSPEVEPNDAAKYKLNTIGSVGWSKSGSSLSYEFTVQKTGLYQIALKAKQNFVSGASSYRKILINGKVPCQQMESVCFFYKRDWQIVLLGDSEGAYPVYLEKGQSYTLTLENTLGDMASVLLECTQILKKLNKIYTDILMLTGPTPDYNRDYQFPLVIPNTLTSMKDVSNQLKQLYDKMENLAQVSGVNMQVLVQIYTQLDAMCNNPNRIAEKLGAYQTSLDSFGSWLNSAQSQPLSLDYILISPYGMKSPSAKTSFLKDLAFQVSSFVASFFVDYNSITYGNTDESVTVWVGSGVTGGRDQAQIIKSMSEDTFTPKTGISVSLKLVSMGALMPSTLAGKGPDVALSLGSGEAANYAFRGAAMFMNSFDGFDEVIKRFSKSAIVPLTFENRVYGLPETESFLMMFYRKDILLQLGITKLPGTWDEVIALLPILQKKQLEFALPNSTGTGASCFSIFSLLLMQNGGALYSDDTRKSAIDSPQAIDAFTFHTNLYKEYQLTRALDFLNRFRSGSAPIGIADYTFYNSLSVFAPELNGLWSFTCIPGTRLSDGTINRSDPAGVTACMILSKAKNPQNAWEFVKWWTDAPAQITFGRQLESIMGTASRYSTANLEALYQIPWSTESFQMLNKQWGTVKGIPEVPGGYFTPRYIDFAFRDVVLQNKIPGDMLINAANTINNEIYQKRLEFRLDN